MGGSASVAIRAGMTGPAPRAGGSAAAKGTDRAIDFRAMHNHGQRSELPFLEGLAKLDWKDREFFLLMANAGSIKKGSKIVGCTPRTARIRFARIEDLMGTSLAFRGNRGLEMTAVGKKLHAKVQKMQASMAEAVIPADDTGTRTALRIAVTEGLGSFWLAPRLVEFQAQNPDLTIHLLCDMQKVDLTSGNFDIAVQLEPISSAVLVPLRLGTLHLMPFAAETYLQAAGTPRDVDDWPHHRLVWQEADQVASHLLPYHIGTQDPGELIAITTNSSSAHFRAVSQGAGIGLLPTYARAISRKVKPIDIGVHIKREIVCAVHASQARLSHVERGIEWLKQAFSAETWPWFQDNFVHPNEFEGGIASGNVVSLFEGYIDLIEPAGGSPGSGQGSAH